MKENPITTVFLCRMGFEQDLAEEITHKTGLGGGASPDLEIWEGMVTTHGPPRKLRGAAPIFARQKCEGAIWLDWHESQSTGVKGGAGDVEQMARRVIKQWLAAPPHGGAWALHCYAPDPIHPLAPLAAALERAVKRGLPAGAGSAAGEAPTPPWVLQLVWGVKPQGESSSGSTGFWGGWSRAEDLLSPRPGGIHRMRQDPLAPSRSYLKMEEALEMMGESPKAGQRVADLGAAPGGWSWSFLKRGCRVLAVDKGPMKLPGQEEAAGELTHLRADGMTFTPPASWLPLDWLVSDMLVPPGKTLGLLRTWLGQRLAARFVVNIKLPQHHPYAALKPIEDFMDQLPGCRFTLRQLYHDRREVTLMG
ncbi:MAG: hypothetical protein OEW12_08225, partial [Deltaproteobacteria bacterium]|nr:hypothetical protein [Deltaproteobacteria bacterium]